MPKGKRLTDYEKGKIEAFHCQGLSCREIGEIINRSKTVVNNFLQNKENYGQKNPGGRPTKLTSRDKRRVLSLVSTGKYSLNEILQTTELPVCKKTIWNVVNSSENFKYVAKLTRPHLLETHKWKRLKFARDVMTWEDKWLEVVFSDEKKFNLDGPDGWKFYWHDLRKEKQFFSKRQMGGGSLMVWGCFSYNGVGPLIFISKNMNAEAYEKLLEDTILEAGPALAGDNWLFQQDNAAIHTAKRVKHWFERQNIKTVDWPAKSPDLNPIENLWGYLARKVYAHGRQFTCQKDLKEFIEDEWYKIPPEICQKLILSMPNRIFETIQKNGGYTHY